MTQIIFWDVDTQIDFMKRNGSLYVPEAEEIIPNLEKLIKYARKKTIPIFGSVDYHSLEDPEIRDRSFDYRKTFPPHCLAGTPGQEKIEATSPVHPLWIDDRTYEGKELERAILSHRGEVFLRKKQFDVFSNPNTEKVLEIVKPEQIVVFGVALDVCDAYAIEGFLKRGHIKIDLVIDAVKAIDKKKGQMLLTQWGQRGVTMRTTEEIVEKEILRSSFD